MIDPFEPMSDAQHEEWCRMMEEHLESVRDSIPITPLEHEPE